MKPFILFKQKHKNHKSTYIQDTNMYNILCKQSIGLRLEKYILKCGVIFHVMLSKTIKAFYHIKKKKINNLILFGNLLKNFEVKTYFMKNFEDNLKFSFRTFSFNLFYHRDKMFQQSNYYFYNFFQSIITKQHLQLNHYFNITGT